MSMAIQRAKYTGDPGFFGDIFGGIKGAIGGAVRGFAGMPAKQPPVPQAGPGMSAASFRLSTPTQKASFLGLAGGQLASFLGRSSAEQSTFFPQVPRPGLGAVFERAIPGGATGMMPAPNGRPMSGGGYHLNKSDYFLKSGEFVPAGTRWVRNRKRNPANARATSRAISRVSSAKTYAKSLGRITIRKKC